MTRWWAMFFVCAVCCPALGQSSSLYLNDAPPPHRQYQQSRDDRVDRLSSHVVDYSFSAVALPEPRKFQMHDLITIVIRESVQNDSKSTLETSKETSIEGEVSDFPRLSLSDLIDLQLSAGDSSKPTPKLGVDFETQFEGEGTQRRVDTFTTRITARIIDIKPNGTLVLEARKTMNTDGEITQLIMTGTCRKDDVTADNTILSTQIYDLHLSKQHEGELRKATKKGILTKILEGIFNF